jgi:hypothetical protein
MAYENFRKQDLTGTDFSGQDLTGANFREANLQKCDFRGAILHYANFKDADVTGAIFDKNTKTSFSAWLVRIPNNSGVQFETTSEGMNIAPGAIGLDEVDDTTPPPSDEAGIDTKDDIKHQKK